ncbi:hypothetical protein TWF506_002664 [Arthrobotrys conoides]|uniref:NACHT domain-containing protein n=1 Tax=Arthrobotrys conoides TaxID=74498 RepID=A0AAN8N4W3_9PEZI
MSAPIPLSVPSPSPFDEALQSFQSQLSAEQKLQFGSTSRKDVEILAIKLQDEQKSRKSHRALGLLRPFIDGLSGYAKIIEVFAQTSEILSFVWGPIKFLLQIGTQWQKAIDTLLDALSIIGEKLMLFEKCTGLILKDSRFRAILVRVYTDILEVLWTAMKVFGKKTHSYEQFLRIHSPIFDKKLATVISNLENDQKLIRDAVAMTHFDEAVTFHTSAEQEFKDAEQHRLYSISHFDEVMRFHANAEKEFKEAARHRLYSTLQIFRQELQPALLSTPRLEDARKISKKSPGAGEWLKNHPSFVDWKAMTPQSNSVLALYGIPGAGKTTLSSILFNSLESDLDFRPGQYSLAHLALGFQPRQNNDCHTALKSLLYDQLAKYPEYAETVLEVLGGEFVQKLRSTEVLQDLLQEIFHFHRPMLLFVDGIDELPNDVETRKFLGILESFLKNCSDIRLFISCRPEELIQRKLRAWGAKTIMLSNAQNRQDITDFAFDPENIRLLVEDCGYDDKTAKKYLNAIVNRADGMFLYAKLILSDLPDLTQGLPIKTLIKELPKGLDQIYDRSLQRIASLRKPLRKYAKRVFKFILGGQRPLRVSELQQAIIVEQNMNLLSPNRSISLTLLCGSLIEILNDDTVSLVHSSLKEYLLTKDNTLGFRDTTIHRSISVICLTYLQRLVATADTTANRDPFGSLLGCGGLVILSYACASLMYHLQEGTKDLESRYMTNFGTKLMTFVTVVYPLCEFAPIPSAPDGVIFSPVFTFLRTPLHINAGTPQGQLSQIIGLFKESLAGEAQNRAVRLHGIQNHLNDIHQKLNTSLQDYAEKCGATELQSLIRTYGPPFKCEDMKCIHFHAGFPDIRQKNQHLDSHNRKFKCPIETCPLHHIGFSTAESLQKHHLSKHQSPIHPISNYSTDGSDYLDSTAPVDIFTKVPHREKADVDINISGHFCLAKDALRMGDIATASEALEECYASRIITGFLHRRRQNYMVDHQNYIFVKEVEDIIRAELDFPNYDNALGNLLRDGSRHAIDFLIVNSLIEHVLFYGTSDILEGMWSETFKEAIMLRTEWYLAVAVMGANASTANWILDCSRDVWGRRLVKSFISLPSAVINRLGSLKNISKSFSSALHDPILLLVQWIHINGVAEVSEAFKTWKRGLETEKYKLTDNCDSDLLLLSSFVGDPSLIQYLHSKTEVLTLSDYKLVLARMISTVSSDDKQQDFYKMICSLRQNGVSYTFIPMDDTLELALSLSLLLENPWSAELFLRGLVWSFEFGVTPTIADVRKIFQFFKTIPSILKYRSENKRLQTIDIGLIKKIIQAISEMVPSHWYYDAVGLKRAIQDVIDTLSAY